jgi:hypothetical protein
MACFALWRESLFFAGAKKSNLKKAPLKAKPLVPFGFGSKNDCWLLFGTREKSAAHTFYMLIDEIRHRASGLLEKNKSGFAFRNVFFREFL